MTPDRHIIFLCVANSVRSQMAEGLARAAAPPGWTVSSAGSDPGRLSSRAVAGTAEEELDAFRDVRDEIRTRGAQLWAG